MTVTPPLRPNLSRALWAALLLLVGTVAGVAFVVGQTGVKPEAIDVSVLRSEASIGRAWELPVARAFQRKIVWQSNASLCGPASLANVNRSLGEPAINEQKV